MLIGRKKITIIFTVKEEFVPGLFYNPEDFATHGSEAIKNTLMAYKPVIVSTNVEDVDDCHDE